MRFTKICRYCENGIETHRHQKPLQEDPRINRQGHVSVAITGRMVRLHCCGMIAISEAFLQPGCARHVSYD
jgi:hypothetical protein